MCGLAIPSFLYVFEFNQPCVLNNIIMLKFRPLCIACSVSDLGDPAAVDGEPSVCAEGETPLFISGGHQHIETQIQESPSLAAIVQVAKTVVDPNICGT